MNNKTKGFLESITTAVDKGSKGEPSGKSHAFPSRNSNRADDAGERAEDFEHMTEHCPNCDHPLKSLKKKAK